VNVAVVGAGPVGIYFAKLCLDRGYKVTLIDSGNFSEESNLLTKKIIYFVPQALFPMEFIELVEVARSGLEE